MTKQELFDTVATALLKQGKPATGQGVLGQLVCQYRTKDGAKCAAGHLIPDDEYKPAMEFKLFPELVNTPALWPENSTTRPALATEATFIGELQEAHDSAMNRRDLSSWLPAWTARMQGIARDHGLSLAVFA